MQTATEDQRTILTALNPRPLSVTQLTERLNLTQPPNHPAWTRNRVRASCRRMEDRGWLRRTNGTPTPYQITSHGERAAGLPTS